MPVSFKTICSRRARRYPQTTLSEQSAGNIPSGRGHCVSAANSQPESSNIQQIDAQVASEKQKHTDETGGVPKFQELNPSGENRVPAIRMAVQLVIHPTLLILDVVHASSDVFPPLKSAVGGVRAITDILMVSGH